MKRLFFLLFLCACSRTPVTFDAAPVTEAPTPELTAPAPCLDALGLGDSKPYCDNLATVLDGSEMLGTFIDEDGFGDSLACLTQLVNQNKLRVLRLEGQFQDAHNFDCSAAGLRKLASLFRGVEPLAQRIRVYASVACEHHCNKAQATQGCRELNLVCPHCLCVNVPLLSMHGALTNGLNECHGREYCAGAASLDGTEPTAVNLKAWKLQRRSDKYICIWRHELNRKKSATDNTPRALRKVVPTVAQLKELIGMSK